MKFAFRILAALLIIGANAWWITAGAHRGWTRTQVPVTTYDEVTGLTGHGFERGFVPGVDLLVLAWVAALVLLGSSFLFGRNNTNNHPQP